jgi:hypothetical protein
MMQEPSEDEDTHSRPFLRILMQVTVPVCVRVRVDARGGGG